MLRRSTVLIVRYVMARRSRLGPQLISASDPTQVGELFGERGGDVAAAGVPHHADVAQAELVEHRRHPASPVGHVARPRRRGLAATREVDPDDVVVVGEGRDHRGPSRRPMPPTRG